MATNKQSAHRARFARQARAGTGQGRSPRQEQQSTL